jgi:hypothetical protein
MTWEELKEEAKKMGAAMYASGDKFSFSGLVFDKDGFVCCEFLYPKGKRWLNQNTVISVNRTLDQMLAIMKALQ